MAQPVSEHITSTPAHAGQPYSADHYSHSDTGVWQMVESGPCDLNSGRTGEEWPDTPPWKQT